MGWFENVISMDGRLQGKARSDRRLMFVTSSSFGLFLGVITLFGPVWAQIRIASLLNVIPQFVVMGLCFCRVHLSHNIVRTYILVIAMGIIGTDMHLRTVVRPPIWPAFVLLADLALVLNLGRRFATGLTAVAALWVVISGMEEMLRFGLFDLPGSAPDWHRWEDLHDTVTCTHPPCPVKAMTGLSEIQFSIFVLLVDFAATRGFAESAEREKAATGRTIETVEAIAQLLAGYDVDTVAEMLQEAEAEGRLPAAMHEALHRLEQNLRAYRPYLPAVLLEEQQHSPDGAGQPCVPPAAAPGAKSERAAIVFTDIRASTSIWEAAPEAMKKAMAVHDTAMRSALSAWGGYEVKTIGDSFMIAFESAHAGVCFGLEVQENLLAAEWPAALLEVGICSPTELWGGLTVRVGVNEGPVTLETNMLTKRVDYFGHTVNVAARLESVCVPGAVAVPAELWTSVRGVSGCVGAYASNAVPTTLKGVSEPVSVCSVWPASLHGRERHPLQAAALSRPESRVSQGSDSALMMCSTTQQDATVAVATLSSMFMREIDTALSGIVPLLEQSDGVLLSLLGNNFFVGWNVGKKRAAHAESALRFAQRALQQGGGHTVASLGIASGTVEHGDVGTARQRFVTASGGAVEASLALSRLAVSMHMRCLYTAEAPPGAVREMLRPTTARVPQHDGPGGVVYEVVNNVLDICPDFL